MMQNRISVGLAAALLSACASVQPPPRPPAPAPAQWQAAWPSSEEAASSIAAWWQRFDDPHLVALQAQARARSPELAQVAARLAQARAQADAAGALRGPQVAAVASGQRGQALPSFQLSSTAQGQLQAAWELDLFGRQRAQSAAALAQREAAAAALGGAQVSLSAEVAQTYLAYRHAQQLARLADADEAAALRQQAAAQAAARAGLLSPAQANEVALGVAGVRIDAAALRQRADLLLQTLAVLVADEAGPLLQRLGEAPPRLAPAFAAPQGLPKQLLAQRPDLVAAREQWVAAVMAWRGAEAARWPQLQWGALIGEGRLELGGGASTGRVWSVFPTLSWPLFDGGLRQAQVSAAQAQEAEARAALEARWRVAVAEVEQSLLEVTRTESQFATMQAAMGQAQRLDASAAQQAAAGLISGTERAAVQRQFIAAQRQAHELALARSVAWISLYRRLGGGWSPEQES